MVTANPSSRTGDAGPSPQRFIRVTVQLLNFTMEALVLVMVCVSPWALGAVDERAESLLYAGITILLALWAIRMLLEWRVSWKPCPVVVCFAAIVAVGVLQSTPLPTSVLSRIAPGTAAIYDRLLPEQPEVVPWGEAREPLAVAPGSTISLYPDATHKSLIRLLAVFSLFVIVRNNIASVGALRRLSIALLANGAALSLFGLVQFFGSSERGTLYWMYASSGTPFGPFVNRNHFAFYINPCIGLTLGLLLVRSHLAPSRRTEMGRPMIKRLINGLGEILHDPGALWISGGLALMLSSVVFCASRGGFLALLAAATASLMMTMRGDARNFRFCATLLSVSASLALLIWFGLEVVEARLSTLWSGEALKDGRAFVLIHAWPLIKDFPLWGTGYGTFQFVEPLQLHTARDIGSIYEHAHNDYLEVLIEGGIIRLGLRLLAIGLIFRYAFRAFRLHAGTAAGAMAVGSLFAFTSIVIHSFFEFGLFIPAIAVLAVVLCANLCGLGEPAVAKDPFGSRRGIIGILFPPVAAVLAVALGCFFYLEGSKAVSISSLRREARGLRQAAFEGSEDRATEIPLLEEVVSLDPLDAERRFILAEAHFDVFKQRSEVERFASGQPDLLTRYHLEAALRQVLYARDLCPLLPAPHTRIAFYVEALANADPRGAYIERAKFLAPADPQLWYLCGLRELADGQLEQAWKSWQQSLQLSDRYLTQILDQAATVLSPDQMLATILPDQPAVLLAAAMYLYPQPEATMERQPLLEKAAAFYDHFSGPQDASEWHTMAVIHQQLGQASRAVEAFEAALAHDPRQHHWRFELATLLYEHGQPQESRRELVVILGLQPNHAAARQLAEVIAREAAEGKSPASEKGGGTQ